MAAAAGFYIEPLAHLRKELARPQDGQFNIVDPRSGTKADIFVAGTDPLVAYGFAGAREGVLAGIRLLIAPPTYLVAMKLRFFGLGGQDKHLLDIRGMLATVPAEIDQAEVTRWAQRYGVMAAWEQCLARPGEEHPRDLDRDA